MLLNIDAGELEDEPEEFAALAHVFHVACGGHAGNAHTMRRTVLRARLQGCRVGAHPSYPDRASFGRVRLDLPLEELEASLRTQVAALAAIARSEGTALTSLKPHGALYHAANADRALASIVASVTRACCAEGACLVGPPKGELRDAATRAALPFLAEGFADRRYEPDGTLRDRRHPDALLASVEDALAQAHALEARAEVQTLCVHGDSPLGLPILRALRAAFP